MEGGDCMFGLCSLDDFEYEGFDETLNDASGREYEKAQLLASVSDQAYDELLYMPNCSKFLLIGPTGYGKSYLAKCYAQTLKEKEYKLYHIDCEDIMEEEEPDQCWKEIFRDILEKTHPEGDYEQKMYLYMENLDLLKDNKKCTKLVASSLKALSDADCRCIILATDIDGTAIPSSVLRQFTIMELGVPDEDERRAYFQSLLGFEIENPYDEEDTRTFYPLSVSADHVQQSDDEEEMDEIDLLAMYCAEETKDLSFGQLEQVLNQVNRKFKARLQDITDGDAKAVFSHVKSGKKHYVVTEDEFRAIIAKVRKSGNVLRQAEGKENSSGNVVNTVASQPQIVYAAPPMMMQGMPMAGAYGMQAYGMQPNMVNPQEQLLNNATDSDNPEVSAVRDAFNMIPNDLDSYMQGV